MAARKSWDDDDGRTIAPMQNVGRQNLFFPGKEMASADNKADYSEPENSEKEPRPWEQNNGLTRQERKWYALGALKAALLIGMTFIVGLGAAILVMLWLWS